MVLMSLSVTRSVQQPQCRSHLDHGGSMLGMPWPCGSSNLCGVARLSVRLLDQTLELAKDWYTAIVPVVYGGPSAPGWECRESLEGVLRDEANSAKKLSRILCLICILHLLGCLSALAGVTFRSDWEKGQA